MLGRKFSPGTHWDGWVKYPFRPGYSHVGRVSAVGEGVAEFKVGDRVATRATHTSVGLERCVQRLRAAAPTGNREADLYRALVLVKAVLEQGDGQTAAEIATELGKSADEEERVYSTWLRVWFDFVDLGEPAPEPDPGDPPAASGDEALLRDLAALPSLTEGDLRIATLAARAHGAESPGQYLRSVALGKRPRKGGERRPTQARVAVERTTGRCPTWAP